MKPIRFVSLLLVAAAVAGTITLPSTGAPAGAAPGATTSATFYPIADAYVDSSAPNTNYGGATTLYVGTISTSINGRALFRFDLSSIPANAVVDSATFEAFLVETSSSPATLEVRAHQILDNWVETGVTWNNQPSVSATGPSANVLTTYQYYTWDLQALAQGWIADPGSNFGLELVSTSEGTFGWRGFASRENTSALPKLTLTYHLPSPLLTLLPSRGGPEIGVQVWGLHFPAGKLVTLYWDQVGPTSSLGQATPGTDGSFSLPVVIPATAAPGPHTVLAYRASDPPVNVSTSFEVVSPPALSLSPLQGPRGAKVAASASNLNADGAISLYWDTDRLLGPIPLHGAATWQGSFVVPQGAAFGGHSVSAVNTVLGREVGRASVVFTVTPGSPPAPTPTPTPWPFTIQAPAQIEWGQPLPVNGQAPPGEMVGIGILGTWQASAWDQVFQAMPVLMTAQAGGGGQYNANVDLGDILSGGGSGIGVAAGAISDDRAAFDDGQFNLPQIDIDGMVTYGEAQTPAAYAVVHASNGWLLYEAMARSDGYYALVLSEPAAGAEPSGLFPPIVDDLADLLRGGEPPLNAVISAIQEELDPECQDPDPYNCDITAFRWSDPSPFDVLPGEQRTIDIHLNHEVTEGPAVTQVAAALDGTEPGDREFGTFLSLPGQGVPVWNTFTATVQPLPPETEVIRVQFRLDDQIVIDEEAADGWTASFDMSELPPGDHTLEVKAYNEFDVVSDEPWLGTVAVWDAGKQNSWWVGEWDITWSEADTKYTIEGTIPPESPFWEETLDLGILGTLHNRLASDITIEETFSINGRWTAEAVGELDATLLDVDILDLLGVDETEYTLTPVYYGRDNPRFHGRPNYYEISGKTWELVTIDETVYDGMLWSWAGLISVRMRLDFGVDGRVRLSVNLEAEDATPSGRLTPTLGAHVDFSLYVDILLGLASGGVTATPQFLAEFPIVLQAGDPYFYEDDPCARFLVLGEAWVKIDVWFWNHRWSWGPEEFVDVSIPEGCIPEGWPPSQLVLAEDGDKPVVWAAPAVAADGFGHALAIWTENQSADPTQPNPEVAARYWDGFGWRETQFLTANDRWETEPRVAFLAPDRALAVWTQNELPRDYDDPNLDLDTMLSNQEIYYSLWDGATWSTPIRLTNNGQPDGRVALAADPASGQALAAWIRDEDGLAATKGDWEIYYAAWDGAAWSAPAAISPNPGAELEVELAYNSAGQAWAVWIRDPDGDLNEEMTSDRRVVYAIWDGAAWSAPVAPTAWPTGVLYPSVAFDSADNPLVVFTARGWLPSGALGGIGHDYLYSAYYKGGNWQVMPVNAEIVAERPRVVIDGQDRATVLFRGIGPANTGHYQGEMAVVTADLTQPTLTWGPVGYLTSDEARDWQIAFDVDHTTGDVHAYGLKQEVTAAAQGSTTAASSETLYALDAMAAPDLVMTEADIEVSDAHPMTQTVLLSATVRNQGLLATTAPFVVRFVLGDAETGTTIGEASVPAPLAAQSSATANVAWASLPGVWNITVSVDVGEAVDESDESNNVAVREVGRPSAPRQLVAARAPSNGHVLLTWEAPTTSGIAGYRVYRAEISGGPYELIGLAVGTIFEDWQNPRLEQSDHYVVTAYDQAGAQSILSEEAAAAPWGGRRVYLPLIVRANH